MLPRADYRPRPLDDRTELILRVENITALTNGQHRYYLHYIGLEAGSYRLAEFLIRPDGSRPDELGDQSIQVHGLLPDDHDGRLNAYRPSRFPFIGGYRAMLGLLGTMWVGGIALYIYWARRKPARTISVPPAPAPSLAERLRPLVEAAAAGQLGAEGQAQLERLLMGYWREKLDLAGSDLRMAEALARLKVHAEAGALLRALECWLHRPGGVSTAEVSALLHPYRNIPAPQPERVMMAERGAA
jgi:hypothetical protein